MNFCMSTILRTVIVSNFDTLTISDVHNCTLGDPKMVVLHQKKGGTLYGISAILGFTMKIYFNVIRRLIIFERFSRGLAFPKIFG